MPGDDDQRAARADDAPPPEAGDDAQLTHSHHPKVLAAIRGTLLANKWPRYQIDDAVYQVAAEAWESLPHPTTVGGWKALGRSIAKRRAIDRIRSEEADGKHSEVASDRADFLPSPTGGDDLEKRI